MRGTVLSSWILECPSSQTRRTPAPKDVASARPGAMPFQKPAASARCSPRVAKEVPPMGRTVSAPAAVSWRRQCRVPGVLDDQRQARPLRVLAPDQGGDVEQRLVEAARREQRERVRRV